MFQVLLSSIAPNIIKPESYSSRVIKLLLNKVPLITLNASLNNSKMFYYFQFYWNSAVKY